MLKPRFLRLLCAMVYDILLLTALLFLATALVLPFNGGEAFKSRQILYPLYLLSVSYAFYGWFWVHGGQTLGLKAWKIKLLSDNRQPVTWRQAFIRYVIAIVSWSFLGLGFLWLLFDKNRRSWHDIVSKTGLYIESSNKP